MVSTNGTSANRPGRSRYAIAIAFSVQRSAYACAIRTNSYQRILNRTERLRYEAVWQRDAECNGDWNSYPNGKRQLPRDGRLWAIEIHSEYRREGGVRREDNEKPLSVSEWGRGQSAHL